MRGGLKADKKKGLKETERERENQKKEKGC